MPLEDVFVLMSVDRSIAMEEVKLSDNDAEAVGLREEVAAEDGWQLMGASGPASGRVLKEEEVLPVPAPVAS